MKSRLTWQIWISALVFAITAFQILPTVLHSIKSLEKQVDGKQAQQVGHSLVKRAQSLEEETLNWIKIQCQRLNVRLESVSWSQNDPQLIYLECRDKREAEFLRSALASAGANIPFESAQVRVLNPLPGEPAGRVTLCRNVRYHLALDQISGLLSHVESSLADDSAYSRLCSDRILTALQTLNHHPVVQEGFQRALSSSCDLDCAHYAEQIAPWLQACADQPRLQRRFWNWASLADTSSRGQIGQLLQKSKSARDEIEKKLQSCRQKSDQAEKEGRLQDVEQLASLKTLQAQFSLLTGLNSQLERFANEEHYRLDTEKLGDLSHPLFQSYRWNRTTGIALFALYPDLEPIAEASSDPTWTQRQTTRLLFENEIARLGAVTGESLRLNGEGFEFDLNFGAATPNWLTFDLSALARQEISHVVSALQKNWKPQTPDLQVANFPILDQVDYNQSNPLIQQLCLVATAPCSGGSLFANLKNSGVYVVAKNLRQIEENAERAGQKEQFQSDVNILCSLLQSRGYILVAGENFADTGLRGSLVFELPDFAADYLRATREQFKVPGGQRFAILELGTLGQRLFHTKRIETAEQEDLLQWRDDFRAAQVDLNPQKRLLVPPPPKNALWQNLKLSWKRYWRADPDLTLKWGLDLTGGRCVRVGLKDLAGRPVTDQRQLEQSREELFSRVNALGISEVAVRIDGTHLALDFPGSQDISASELVQASSMAFHIVNERFSTDHPQHGALVNEFLRGVWNEALLTGKKDAKSLNAIANRRLHERADGDGGQQVADKLRALGLQLADGDQPSSNALDETLSMIAAYRSDDYRDWYRQNHPLVVVFKNFALEGRNLEDVQVRADSNGGHVLTFGIKKRLKNDQTSPSNSFFDWTQQFAKDQILGTSRELDRNGRGWRMAVLLQSQIVSSPELATTLRDRASITGHFTQREIQRLATDLKAGSLSFVPEVLSEENVQPQLGKSDRARGIAASLAGFAGVVSLMVYVYGFAGWIASAALGLNLLIVSAVLQNLGAAITLPGIAGIVLTMGMAVDANVLIFERMREELRNNSLAKAFQLGYRRALPAIADSNITTALAALILIQFDLGPIKGFAITLVTGLLSSTFTGLFATHAFFETWIRAKNRLDLGKERIWRKRPLQSLSKFPLALGISSLLLLAGLLAGWQQRHTLLGIDFSGGYTVSVAVQPIDGLADRVRIERAFSRAGLNFGQYQVRQLQAPHHFRIDLSHSLQAPGGPFDNLPEAASLEVKTQYPYEKSPQISWIVDAFRREGIELTPANLKNLHSLWSTTSSQFSIALRHRAGAGLGCGLFISLIYLALRFEINYALAATLALIHTLAMTASAGCLLHWMQLPIELNLYVIGALMTIIGYCLNDMIIVFDRIREDRRQHTRQSWRSIIDRAIQQTLSRTVMTCGTTLVVLVCLILFGGPNLFGFSSVMALGVVLGTFSSLYIASPLLLMLQTRREGPAWLAKVAERG